MSHAKPRSNATISVSEETKDRLARMCPKTETWDGFLDHMADVYEETHR
jgi:hypothetical protein